MTKQKLIGIDARLYFQTGVGVYIRNFLHYLQLYSPESYRFNVYVLEKDSDQIHFQNPNFIKREVASRWHTIAEQFVFNRILMNDNLDLMHFTYFSYPVLYSRPFIATIHDVTPLLFKTGKASTLPSVMYEFKHKVFGFILKQQVVRSQAIITPTQAVKNQLIDIYGTKYADKISVLYEGVNYEFFNAVENDDLKKQYKKPFFLYVGNFYPHKNVDLLVQAFHQLGRPDIELILAGPSNFFSGRLENYIATNNIPNVRMYHPSFPGDLLFLYKNARALINPSLSEGFGLPIVEAAYCGCPIIASNIDVFKEILGDHYTSFNPHSSESLTETLSQFLKSSGHKKAQLDKKFSFQKMVQDYFVLIERMM